MVIDGVDNAKEFADTLVCAPPVHPLHTALKYQLLTAPPYPRAFFVRSFVRLGHRTP